MDFVKNLLNGRKDLMKSELNEQLIDREVMSQTCCTQQVFRNFSESADRRSFVADFWRS